jgi:hypothetical protein
LGHALQDHAARGVDIRVGPVAPLAAAAIDAANIGGLFTGQQDSDYDDHGFGDNDDEDFGNK